MKLHLTNPKNRNLFTGHGPGYIAVSGTIYHTPLLVAPDSTVVEWPVSELAALTAGDVRLWLEHTPDIIILGSGPKQLFPSPEVLRPLYEARIGLEVMDTPAACRTYNILVAEERRVLAALWLP